MMRIVTIIITLVDKWQGKVHLKKAGMLILVNKSDDSDFDHKDFIPFVSLFPFSPPFHTEGTGPLPHPNDFRYDVMGIIHRNDGK